MGPDPLRITEMIWLKMQANNPEKLALGTGKHLRDQHETILIAVRGNIPPALPLWPSVLTAMVGKHSEKLRLLMDWIDRDYGPELVRIEMFARPPFDRPGWHFWGDAVPGRDYFVLSCQRPPEALRQGNPHEDERRGSTTRRRYRFGRAGLPHRLRSRAQASTRDSRRDCRPEWRSRRDVGRGVCAGLRPIEQIELLGFVKIGTGERRIITFSLSGPLGVALGANEVKLTGSSGTVADAASDRLQADKARHFCHQVF